MPWIVGIDEAGYGPNLGPFVMTCVAWKVPQSLAQTDLWEVFRDITRRHSDKADGRFLVADSKLVYGAGQGLARLETAVHAFLHGNRILTLAELVNCLCPPLHQNIDGEYWYRGTTCIPIDADPVSCFQAGKAITDLCKRLGITCGHIRSAVVCASAFNAVLEQRGSKGAVLAASLVMLLRGLPPDDEPASIIIDKHGGRNNYSAVLQPAFDGGLVMAQAESHDGSTYEVVDNGRTVRVTIQPRADANHFCVALASMVSKYVREILMLEFNRFWQTHIPGLKATAGYPVDSKRYWEQIKDTARRLTIPMDAIWRRK